MALKIPDTAGEVSNFFEKGGLSRQIKTALSDLSAQGKIKLDKLSRLSEELLLFYFSYSEE